MARAPVVWRSGHATAAEERRRGVERLRREEARGALRQHDRVHRSKRDSARRRRERRQVVAYHRVERHREVQELASVIHPRTASDLTQGLEAEPERRGHLEAGPVLLRDAEML